MKPLSRFQVSFWIGHPSVDPEEISAALELQPFGMARAGEPRKTPKGNPVPGVNKLTTWRHHLLITTGTRLPDALSQFNKTLSGKAEYLRGLVNTGGTLEYFIGAFMEDNRIEELSWQLLKECADLQISLTLDMYPQEQAME
ncbi:MAG: DUF4279 domain-containing protein [Alphaproteobacteria bacterium]